MYGRRIISQIPVPAWTKDADDGKLGSGFFCWKKQKQKKQQLGVLRLFLVYLITDGADDCNRGLAERDSVDHCNMDGLKAPE